MKNAIILVCLLFSAFAGYSQVGIGTKNPDTTSVLDLSSTTKGLLIPRMTTSQRDRIEAPAVGLQVYNLDDHCLDMYDGKSWLKHCGSESGINSRSVDDLIWALEGDDIYTVPMENVGIGTSDPDESALLDLTSYSKGFLMPRMSTMYRDAIASPAPGLQILNTDDYCIDIYNGANWVKHCGMKENGQILTQEYWQQRADFMSVRRQAVGFSIGSKGYIGTGTLFFSDDITKDFWEYDPALDTWTQKADCGTINRGGATGFSIGNFGYIGTGYDDDGGKLKDFWQYNPNNNTWTKKLDFPGEGRSNSVGFSIEGRGYIGTGKTDGSTGEKDFYRYNPDNNSWASVADLPGSKRYGAVAFTIFYYGYAYVGGGASSNGAPHDFWKYNPFNDSWLPIDNLPDPYGTSFSVGLDLYYRGGVVTGNGIGNQFFIYDPSTEEWSTGIPFPGYPRNEATGFSINGIGYVGTGSEVNNTTWPAMYVDFWRISAGNFVNSYESTLTDPYYNSISVSDGLWTQELSGGYLDVPGNLGIGITSPQNKIDINSGSSRTGHHPLNRPLYVTGDILANSSGVEFRDVNGTQGIGFGYNTIYATGSNTDQNLGLKARGSGILNFITNDAERMRITGGGNVGIGLTTPKTKLHILGGSSASLGETTGYAVFGPTIGANLVLDENEILARNNGAVANLILQEEGGNVGIGTSGPEELLEVGGSGRAFFGDGGEGNNRTGLLIDGNESGDFTRLESYNYQTQTGMNLIINTVGFGNVGIGTSDPEELLEIGGGGRAFFGDGGGDNRTGLLIDGNEQGDYVRLESYDYAQEVGRDIVLNSTGHGKVGIDITSPAQKLHVNGNAVVSANLGIGITTPTVPLQFSNSDATRKIVLSSLNNNDNQFSGFGVEPNKLRYNIPTTSSSHVFMTGNSPSSSNELMRIQGDGNVGVGVPFATNKMDINFGVPRTGTHPPGLPLYVTGPLFPSSNGIEFRLSNGTQGIGFGSNTIYATGSQANQDLGLKARGSAGTLNFTTNNLERMVIKGNGNIGIGTSSPNHQLELTSNDAFKIGTAAWVVPSDTRLKKDIEPFTDGLDLVRKINPIWFRYNGLNGITDTARFAGIIAQEIQKIAPYMIGTTKSADREGESYLSYDANSMTYILINAVKEQQIQIQQQQARIDTLEKELKAESTADVADMKAMMAQMQQEIQQLKQERK